MGVSLQDLEKQIEEAERQFGRQLPPDVRAAWASHDGVDGLLDERGWRIFSLEEAAAAHEGQTRFVMACKTYGRRLRALALELRGESLSIRLGPDTPIAPEVAASLQRQTQGRPRLAGPDRIVAIVSRTSGPRRQQLETCQKALAQLVTYASS